MTISDMTRMKFETRVSEVIVNTLKYGQCVEIYTESSKNLSGSIKESNFDFPAGKISEGDAQSLLRMSSKFKTAEEISKTVVSANPDGVIRLSDVAEVSDIQKEYKTLYRINGVQSLIVLIKKKTDANTIKVNEAIKNEFKLLEEKYKNENLKFLIPNDARSLSRMRLIQ